MTIDMTFRFSNAWHPRSKSSSLYGVKISAPRGVDYAKIGHRGTETMATSIQPIH